MTYKKIEELRREFERSVKAREHKLNFFEYAILHRYFEGMQGIEINETLFISTSTIYRHKQKIIKKLKANSFEHALAMAGAKLFY